MAPEIHCRSTAVSARSLQASGLMLRDERARLDDPVRRVRPTESQSLGAAIIAQTVTCKYDGHVQASRI
ncbi:hypothetical protein AWC03_01155 [Mycobacterium europaeum]|nr:hypothetical protein AWC03_01155 [Mycobacterium europaeum]